jgi:hypothetical protein
MRAMTARSSEVAEPSRGRRAMTAAWGALGAAACWSVAGLEPNLVEEGLVLHVAQRLAAGEHLYRDIVFFTSPLPFELLGLLFRIFGEEIAVGRAAMAALLGAASAATFAFANRAGAGWLSHAAAACLASAPLLLFPMFSMFYYTPLALCLGVLAVEAASRGLRSRGWAFTAGLLVGAVALSKQTLGGALALSLLPAFAVSAPAVGRRAGTTALVLGGAALTVATLLFYGLHGDLGDLWRCLVVIPLGLSDSYRAPFINLWPPGRFAEELMPNKAVYFSNLYFLGHGIFSPLGTRIVLATQLLYALPLLALAATLLRRLAGPLPTALRLHTALLLAMTANLFPRSDWGHLVVALPPACVQLLMLAALPRGWALRFPLRAGLVSGCLVAVLATSRAPALLCNGHPKPHSVHRRAHGAQRRAAGAHPRGASPRALRGDERHRPAPLDLLRRRAAPGAAAPGAVLPHRPLLPHRRRELADRARARGGPRPHARGPDRRTAPSAGLGPGRPGHAAARPRATPQAGRPAQPPRPGHAPG